MSDRNVRALVEELLEAKARGGVYEAKVKALRDELAVIAVEEAERSGADPSWRIPELGSASWVTSKPVPYVTHPKEFIEWVRTNYPEVMEDKVADFFYTRMALDFGRTDDGHLVDGNGEIIPGVQMTVLKQSYIQVKPAAELKERAALEEADLT